MKTLWNFLKSRFLWINVLISVLLIVVAILILHFCLRSYTNHGEEIEVPDLSGLYVGEAEVILKDCNLDYKVIDSIYSHTLKGGEIAEQSPAPGTMVKENRKVYLTINSKNCRMISLPDVIGESKRNVQTNLISRGFSVSSIEYKPYEYNDQVLAIKYNERILESGDKVPEGASLVLVVGQNESSYEIIVPSFIGVTLQEALQKIKYSKLSLGSVSYDVPPINEKDAERYIIYEQQPESGIVVSGGKSVDLKLSKGEKGSNSGQNNDEEFF